MGSGYKTKIHVNLINVFSDYYPDLSTRVSDALAYKKHELVYYKIRLPVRCIRL